MRGLIIKDMLFIKNTWKHLIVMFIGSVLLSIAAGNYLLAIVVLPLMLLTSGINTFQTDEFYNTESYTLCYPLSRKKIVLAKFMFTIIMLLIATYLGCMIYLFLHYVVNIGYNGANTKMLSYLLMLECASLIVDAIFYPVIYKYGCEKSRFVLLSITMLLLGIFSVLSVYINTVNKDLIDFTKVFYFVQDNGLTVLSIASIIALVLSYLISIKVFKHKDY